MLAILTGVRVYLVGFLICISLIISDVEQFFFFCLFAISWAASSAHGGSQARGWIRATATATRDPSRICDLHHSPRQHQILDPLSKARDQTHNLTVPSWTCFCCVTMATPGLQYLLLWLVVVSWSKAKLISFDIMFFLVSFVLEYPFIYEIIIMIFKILFTWQSNGSPSKSLWAFPGPWYVRM